MDIELDSELIEFWWKVGIGLSHTLLFLTGFFILKGLAR